MNKQTLYIVYNANGGLMNGVKDSLHKLIQPHSYPCKLCELTHGYLSARKEWKDFLLVLKDERIGVEILHKDELSNYPFDFDDLPGIYTLKEGSLSKLMGKKELARIDSIESLIRKLRSHLMINSSSDSKRVSYTH
jgi:hypothetical protein